MTPTSFSMGLVLFTSLVAAESTGPTLAGLEKRCAEGAATACFEAGLRHDKGTSRHDAQRAAHFFTLACDGDDMRGCNSAGVCHRRGHGVTVNAARARSLMKRACDANLAVGCFNLGAMLAEGDGGPADLKEAARLFNSACDAKYGPACTAGGATALSAQKELTQAIAVKAQAHFKRGCDLRDAEGCYNFGQLSRQLDGPTPGAFHAYRQACRLGVAAGCGWQGLMLHRGEGQPTSTPSKKSQRKGVRLMQRSCDEGFHEGCFNAAIAYVKGHGVRKDHQTAGRLFTRACKGGVAPACALLERQKKRSK